MTSIQNGIAHGDNGKKFWEIRNSGQTITEFNHHRFPDILSGANVYFMDLDLDPRLCENVQVVDDVDNLISLATPGAGIDSNAKERLQGYVMAALLHALNKQGAAKMKYLDQLKAKMDDIRISADTARSSVTLALLAQYNIV